VQAGTSLDERGEWRALGNAPIAWKTLFGVVASVAKKHTGSTDNLPLEVIAAKVAEKWPGRWQGPFEVNNLGPRFWDETADNPNGCQIKPDGMLCFTGNVPFMSWEALFGAKWCDENRVRSLGNLAADSAWDGRTYFINIGGVWRDYDRESTLLHLACGGLSTQKVKGQTVSEAHRVLHHINTFNRVEHAAPFVCRRPGMIEIDGRRMLNTCNLIPVQPAQVELVVPERDFPFIWSLAHSLYGAGFHHAMAWHKRFYESVLNHKPTMGQALFLAGPVNSGKTLWCLHVVKPLAGYRSANPWGHLTARDAFNDELFECALLAMNDEDAPSNDREASSAAQRLKGLVVNPEQSRHPKFRKKASLVWCGRVFGTLNCDAASAAVLPEVNENTRDKFMFFLAQAFPGKWPENPEAAIARELAMFARWLLQYNPPAEIWIGGRTGVESYFDPSLLELSKQQSGARDLYELIALFASQSVVFDNTDVWTGTPTALYSAMIGCEPVRPLVQQWQMRRFSTQLRTLARMENSGIEHVEGTAERDFKITKSILLKR